MRCINRISSNINSMRSGPDPEHSNAGGGGGGGHQGRIQNNRIRGMMYAA